MIQLEKLIFDDANVNKAKVALIKHLKTKNDFSARAALKHFIDVFMASKTVAAIPVTHFLSHKNASIEEIATALTELDVTNKARLFESETVDITPNYLNGLHELSTTLANMASLLREQKLQALLDERSQHGFTHMLLDLQDVKHNQTGTGWAIQKGLLKINPSHLHNEKTIAEVHAYLSQPEQLGEKKWYQRPEDRDLAYDLGLYDLKFKTLGCNGENKAVDPLFILKGRDGKLKILSGQRFDKSYALPGGMNETNVIDTCISELLEECFSGSLFKQGSQTERLLNEITDPKNTLNSTIDLTLKNTIIKNLYAGKSPAEGATDYKKLVNIHRVKLDEATRLADTFVTEKPDKMTRAEHIRQVVTRIQHSDLDKGKKAPLIAHVRCEIYKHMLPVQYAKLETFVKDRMHKEDLELNDTDPRNTDYGAMYTNPVEAIIDEDDLTTFLENECGLEFGAGDDLGNVKYRDIEDFAGNITAPAFKKEGPFPVYSNHASFMLNAIKRGVERGEIAMTPQVLDQLHTIANNNHLDPKIIQQLDDALHASKAHVRGPALV